MPETREIVINTGPIIALVAAMGDLSVLQIYERVWVPYEVQQEIVGGRGAMVCRRRVSSGNMAEKAD